jgi:hypothetical protein
VAATPVLIQSPKLWTASIGNGDASLWKKLLSQNAGAGASGTKMVSAIATSDDTSARSVTLAHVRTGTATFTLATPGVCSVSAANNNNLSVGDQIWFETTGTLPTGITAGTTYWVISAGFTAGVSFEFSATPGGAAINTSVSQSGVHTCFMVRPLATESVAITAGQDGATAIANFLTSLRASGLPLDNDGAPYILLESGDYLAVSCLATVTANKMISVGAIGGNF